MIEGYGEQPLALPEIENSLAGTRPWLRFMAVLIFISVGFTIIGGLVAAFTGEPAAFFFTLFYLAFGIAYLYLGRFLWNQAVAIDQFLRSKRSSDLALAMENQRKFWKMAGILTIIGIVLAVLYLVVIVVFLAAAFGS